MPKSTGNQRDHKKLDAVEKHPNQKQPRTTDKGTILVQFFLSAGNHRNSISYFSSMEKLNSRLNIGDQLG